MNWLPICRETKKKDGLFPTKIKAYDTLLKFEKNQMEKMAIHKYFGDKYN